MGPGCLVFLLFVPAFSCSDVKVYEKPGDYIIGGLLPIHWEDCHTLRELETLHRLEAMAYAVRMINERTDILPNITLGFRIYDTCSYEPTTLARATLFVPDVRINRSDYETCSGDKPKDQKPVIGVVGAELSATTLAAAQFFSVYDIPLVSFFATSEDLSDEKRYPYFMRMVPSDRLQVKAIVDVLLNFEWTYVSIIYSSDSYGRNALNLFREEIIYQTSICLKTQFEVSTDTPDFVIDIVVSVITTQAETAKVVILFTQTNHANRILAAMNRTGAQGKLQIIGSDGWGMSIGEIDQKNRPIALGAIKTQLPDEEVPEFEEYFFRLTLAVNNTLPGHDNPWLWLFQIKYAAACFQEYGCDKAYGIGFSESSGVSRVLDAVKTIAFALDDMLRDHCWKTVNSEPPCDASDMVVTGKDLYRRMKGVVWNGSRYGKMFSHPSGEVVKDRYELEVIRQAAGGAQYELKRIGQWSESSRLNMTEANIPWGAPGKGGKYSVPPSYCSKQCQAGHVANGIGNANCCWQCTPCAVRDIVNGTVCKQCGEKENPNDSRTSCVPAKPLYISWSDPIAIVLVIITSLGILVACMVLSGYIGHNQHTLIKASSRELSYLMLVGVFLCYGLVFAFFGRPTVATCYVIRHGFMLGFTFTYAPLLTRANRIYRIFWAGKRSTKRPGFISPKSQVFISSIFILIQLVISISLQINNPPAPEELVPTPGTVEIMCNIRDHEMIISLCYNVVLVLLCSVHAFITRRVPTNYNESRFISLSVYTTIVIWLAFIPCYFLIPGAVIKLVVMSVALIVSGSITLAFMFLSKLYAVYFVSEDNVHAAGTYREQASVAANGEAGASGNILLALGRDVRGTARSMIRGSSVVPAADSQASQIELREEQALSNEKLRQRCFPSLAGVNQDTANSSNQS